MEKMQRSIIRQIQYLPPNTAITAVYGLLGLRPIEQELDMRKLTLLRNILCHKFTLEYEIAQRQMSVKDLESKSWFSDCNRLLYKYSLPNIYTLDRQIDSVEARKSQLKKHIDPFIEKEWIQNDKTSLRFLNVKSLRIEEVHHAWKSVPNDPRTVKRVYSKTHLLTSTYILQENRARFNQYKVNECCPVCGTEAEERVHFLAVCSRLVESRQGFICELVSILSISRNSDASVRSLIKGPQCLTQIILDCSVIADARLLERDEDMLVKIEKMV